MSEDKVELVIPEEWKKKEPLEVKAPQRNIAILGSAPPSRLLAPFDDVEEWEIWACSSENLGVLPRVDVWFELHSLIRKAAEKPAFVQMLSRHPCVYLQEEDPQWFVGSKRYPIERMLKKYSTDLLTSSAAFMMALAIEKKPKQIGIYGLDLATISEYANQRAGMKLMIREAEKAGILVTCPPQCDLLEPTPLYAYKEAWPMFWKLKTRRDDFQDTLDKLNDQRKKIENEMSYVQGALHDTQYTMAIWLKQ